MATRTGQDSHVSFYVSPGDAPAKRKILTAALTLFARDGLCETSVRDIASASGYTNPALFKHFPSKDALARYLFERCYLELATEVATAVASSERFAPAQRAVIDTYLAALERNPESVLFVQDHLRHFWPRRSAALRKQSMVAQVRTLLERGRAEGRVTTEIEIELLVAAWMGTLQQFGRLRYFGEFRQPLGTFAPKLEKLLTRLVGS